MIGKVLSVVPSVIKRGDDVKQYHAKQGIDASVFSFNKLTLAEGSKAVKEFQATIAKAYDTLAKALPAKLVSVIGEEQVSTMVSLSKDNAMNNPFPADIQSFAHRQNLTDAGTVTVWKLEKAGAVGAVKANYAAGIEM